MQKKYKQLRYWLHFFGFGKRERSLKEKMCDSAIDLCKQYKEEAREATRQLRSQLETEKQVA